ncbi:MAG TPA: TorF family putative porin [Gammaproteobacteria bacterium]|nr:TorF family putative porin [Gammaproteobacteria bacterium]
MKNKRTALYAALAILAFESAGAAAGSLSGNAAVTNNYLWRGLTQTENSAAVSGGLDYAAENGFYAGTWVSNVHFAPSDPFSYENDLYFGYSGGERLKYDVGYIYYNYDAAASADFGEVYGKFGIKGLTASLYALTQTQLTAPPGRDYGLGESLYLALDYSLSLENEVSVGLHAGRYSGDFQEDFNGVPRSYLDYNVSVAKGGFTFMISDTNLPANAPNGFDNGSLKFVIAYKVGIALRPKK